MVPKLNSSRLQLAALIALAGLAACAVSPTASTQESRGSDALARRAAAAPADVIRLQSELMALADTAIARITAETAAGTLDKDPAVREFSHITRLNLCTSLLSIVTSPDPVDALLDMLTFSTLVADAARNAARGKAPDSVEVRVLRALELNEADAWKLSERWLDAAVRSALREQILSWPGQRRAPAEVGYVRLSDLPRTGSATAAAVEGVLDSLRAAVKQAEQVRLLGERSIYLAQRMPFALRWQAEFLTYNTLAMDESRRLLEQVGGLTDTANSVVREVAGLPAQLSREREVALKDLFAHIERERRSTLEQLAVLVQKERSAALAETGAAVAAQRKALIDDLIGVAGRAEERGVHWANIVLMVGVALIVALLVSLLGMLLLYHRLVQRMDRRSLSGTGTRVAGDTATR